MALFLGHFAYAALTSLLQKCITGRSVKILVVKGVLKIGYGNLCVSV